MNDSESIDERELFNRVYDPRTFRIKNLLKDHRDGEQPAISLLTNNDDTESAVSPSKNLQTSQQGSDIKDSDAGYTSDGSPFKQTGGLYSSCFDESEAKKYGLQQSHNSLLESKLSSSTTRSPLMNTQKLALARISHNVTPEPKDPQCNSKNPGNKGQFDSFGTPHNEPIRELSYELESNAGDRSADRLQQIAYEKLQSVRRLSEDIITGNAFAEEDFQQNNSQRSLSYKVRMQHRLADTQTSARSGTRHFSMDLPIENSLLREPKEEEDYGTKLREESLKNSCFRVKNDIDLPQHANLFLESRKSKQSDAYYSFKTGSASQNSAREIREEDPPKLDSRRFIFSDKRLPEVTIPENKPLLNTSFTLGKKPKLGLSQGGMTDFNQYNPRTLNEAEGQGDKFESPEASEILHPEASVLQSQKTTPGKVQNSLCWEENTEQINFSQSLNRLDQEKQVVYLEKKCRELTTALQRQTYKTNTLEKERCMTVQELKEEVSRLQNQLFQKNVESQKQINVFKNHQKKVLNDQPGLYKDLVHRDQVIQEQEKHIYELRSQVSELAKLSTMHTTERDISRISSVARLGHSKIYVEDDLLPDESNKENLSAHSNGGSTAASTQVRLRDYENQILKLKKEIDYLKNETNAKPNMKTHLAAQEIIQALSQPESLSMLKTWGAMTELKCEIRARDIKGILGKSEDLLDAVEQANIEEDQSTQSQEIASSSSVIFESVIQLAMDLSQKLGGKTLNASMMKGEKLWVEIETLYYRTESELFNALKAKFPVEPASVLAGKEGNSSILPLQDRTNQSVYANQSLITEKQPAATLAKTTEKRNVQSGSSLQDKELIFSDFSDDDFANEDQEEKLAITALANIKSGVRESKLSNSEFNPIKQLLKQNPDLHLPPQKDHVFVDQLNQILEAEDIRTPLKEFVSLILRLDPTIKGVVNLVQFLENVRSKNQLWWKNKIHNAHFDLKYKHTNLTPLFARDSRVRDFVFRVINEKIQQFKVHKGLTELENLTAFIAGFSTDFLTKAGLRAFFRGHKFLFTRLETHVLQYLLEQASSQSKGGVSVVDLKELLINGDIFRVYAKICNEGNAKTLRPRQKGETAQPLKTITRLRAELLGLENARYSPIKIKDAFKLADKRFTGLLNYQQFKDVCQEYELPFQDHRELADLFEYLAKDYASRCPATLAKIENNIFEEGRIQYGKFVEMIFERVEDGAEENNENSNVASKLRFTEAKLKLAEQKILELENQTENSATVNRSGVLIKPKDQFSNERTLRMKVEDLEFENARLRQTLSVNEKKERNTSVLRQLNETEVPRALPEQTIQLGNRKYRVEEAVQKFESLESAMIVKELELQNELKVLKKSTSDEIVLKKRQLEHERIELAKVIEGKNKEIRDYRNELEVILAEMEELRRQTYRGVA